MKIRVLGCYGGVTRDHRVTGFLINDHILLDPGTVADPLTLEEQNLIDVAIISHSHLDHCAGIAFLADNIFAQADRGVRIIAMPKTAEAIQKHLLNGTMWPDFTSIANEVSSIAAIETLSVNKAKPVEELVITPFPAEHTVPTVGFVIADEGGALLYSADTSDITAAVDASTGVENLRLAIVEASFPNRMRELARKTGHLVPEMCSPLVKALGNKVPIRLFHMKPRYVDEIRSDAASLDGDVALLSEGEVLQV
ncbi:3',5'-cyclic-nucleotide phosphodiesterase [bacterium]|nr:3',5'-cyclic-nucleotide phosphodiesterase [bacterium]